MLFAKAIIVSFFSLNDMLFSLVVIAILKYSSALPIYASLRACEAGALLFEALA